MQELIVNLHMHTRYSDGHASHAEIAQAALKAGLDIVIVTDHNIYVNGPENYYRNGEDQVLLLVGEEIHDQSRDPQKNHLLVFGTNQELATYADDPQRLIDRVKQVGGLSFIAHPIDPAAPAVGESDISWVDWEVQGFSGIELWNGLSEFKSLLKTKLHALFYAYNPKRVANGPHPKALKLWDELLSAGEHIVAIGGSDAHAIPARLGPIMRTLFPYEFHFRAINTHILVTNPLSGDLANDRQLVMEALACGHAFIGYDLPAPTRGFHFTAHVKSGTAWMGDEISAKDGVTFQIRLPRSAECNLLKDGVVVKTWHKRDTCTYITSQPGVYRVEVYIHYQGRRRGWIYSNPIYVTA
jgi:hypothetical protein